MLSSNLAISKRPHPAGVELDEKELGTHYDGTNEEEVQHDEEDDDYNEQDQEAKVTGSFNRGYQGRSGRRTGK